jgi:hypothetical protein
MEIETPPRTVKGDSTAAVASIQKLVGAARVDVDFFRAFGVPILTGREFQAGDASPEARVVLVNRSFVRVVLGDSNALGRRVRRAVQKGSGGAESAPSGPWYEIVGVVPDFPTPRTASDVAPRLYWPMLPERADASTIVVRVKGATPLAFTGRLREIAVAVDPMLRLEDVRPLDDALTVQRMADRVIFTAVALVTMSVLLLSAGGIYALMSFTIARRRREIGIRAALGAGARQVLGSVLAKAAKQIGTGIAIGIALAAVLVQGMEGGMADVRGAVVLVAVIGIMTLIGLAAALGPARRALRIQPTEALRSE